eukprot:CCRYP_018727-RA/>CCRYP_018727-RA protein AED:0.09 eAED:0.24 QI:0/-1/0/1/-1/0/1/0/151
MLHLYISQRPCQACHYLTSGSDQTNRWPESSPISACHQGCSKKRPCNGRVKKPHWYHPGTVALHKICRYQKSTDLLIRMVPFQRLARKFLQNLKMPYYYPRFTTEHFQATFLLAMQESVEAFSIRLLDDATLCVIHAMRVIIMPKDMQLVL